jgi:hypothetical protein
MMMIEITVIIHEEGRDSRWRGKGRRDEEHCEEIIKSSSITAEKKNRIE